MVHSVVPAGFEPGTQVVVRVVGEWSANPIEQRTDVELEQRNTNPLKVRDTIAELARPVASLVGFAAGQREPARWLTGSDSITVVAERTESPVAVENQTAADGTAASVRIAAGSETVVVAETAIAAVTVGSSTEPAAAAGHAVGVEFVAAESVAVAVAAEPAVVRRVEPCRL